ncbi:uncharacterized protein L201_000576 [Kwoniella dendrophila CBS 6074]|uniref:Poly(A) RNA polymerase mitochondrial-like central palm domain-containing protein n=1 Tax=Kwoniella dendrophila CBS 6074 TaxID=1295534 RepID=A0AAX4JMF7_9TREE
MESLRILLTTSINEKVYPYPMEDGRNRFEVEIVGSSSWGGEIGSSTDIDLVIVDRMLPKGYEPSLWLQPPGTIPNISVTKARLSRYLNKSDCHSSTNDIDLPGCYYLKELSDLIDNLGMTHIIRSPQALPLLKFVDPKRKLGCDLQCNNLSGLYNCSLILHYCQISPFVLRPLICFVKNWYKVKSGKDPKTSNRINPFKLSSYCLSLICISYLQHIGHLPNLQKNINVKEYSTEEDWLNDDELVWSEWGKLQGTSSHTFFTKSVPHDWKASDPTLTVDQAVRGFFRFFSQNPPQTYFSSIDPSENVDQFVPLYQIISPLDGGITSRSAPYKSPTLVKMNESIIGDKDQQIRYYLVYKGYSTDQIKLIMNEWKIQKAKKLRMEMGKGNLGLQPPEWEKNRLVVQDPFIWTKNQAASMDDQAFDTFFECVTQTDKNLASLGSEATVEHLLET